MADLCIVTIFLHVIVEPTSFMYVLESTNNKFENFA